jgi:hypothetical protein
MARRIMHLIEEQEKKSKLVDTRSPDVKVARELRDSQNIVVSISGRDEVVPLSLGKEP